MIKRLLIANRGEIALRIIRACRELGIESVAVYSEADEQAPHVAAADRAVAIGPAPAADSYLSMPRLLDAAQAARREATAAFGDGTLYVERLIEPARHVEVQVFGDDHGQVVHLFERECSVQRRHQKVIEESPSPAVTAGLRDAMTSAAVR